MTRYAAPMVALLAALAASPLPSATPQSVLDAAPASAWRDIPPEDLLLMTLADGATVSIRLAPEFAPVHVANIRALVRAGWFDDGAISRVHENYVVQWAQGAPDRALPEGVVAAPPAEYERAARGLALTPFPYRDSYAPIAGHAAGWPVAGAGELRWLAHCYGMVGVGRDMAPDTGTGAELYAVIGHAPRQLDRNIALVGRVLGGMEAMTALPRGTGPLGFYEKPEQRTAIRIARIAADLPQADRPAWQYLDTASPSFAEWVRVRANRKDDFYIRPANGLDLCNAMPPVRPKA